MKTNADITIYNKYIDAATRAEKYQRSVIAEVNWENCKAAMVRRTGELAADKARVFIPFVNHINYLAPKAWQALTTKTNNWTLQEGDIIVRGIVTDEISSSFTVSALKAKYDDVLTIRSVDTYDQGSARMQHWEIGAT